jgi:CRISPR-associated RAMP protein (TIGR02581 family)
MLKALVNELRLTLTVTPVEPILIRSGVTSINGIDMGFVTTVRGGRSEPEPYIPGTSLKGVVRSHAERIARSVDEAIVCNPLDNKTSCSQKHITEARRRRQSKETPLTTQDAYRSSCLACRLFGSLGFMGRVSIGDAYVDADARIPRAQVRDGVGIDRWTGGAYPRAKFDFEVVSSGDFRSQWAIRNFELWQLGWLGHVLSDFKDEWMWIGAGKSRGLGRVRGTVDAATLSYVGRQKPPDGEVWGVGASEAVSNIEDYGIERDDKASCSAATYARKGIRSSANLDGDGLTELMESLESKFASKAGMVA